MAQAEYPQDLGLFIDGAWRRGGGRDTREVINPATGEVIGSLPLATPDDLDDALAAADKAFASWRHVSAWQRAAILSRAAQLILERKATLASALTLDNGKRSEEHTSELQSPKDLVC